MSNFLIESAAKFMGEGKFIDDQREEYRTLAKTAGADSVNAFESKDSGKHLQAAKSHLAAIQKLHPIESAQKTKEGFHQIERHLEQLHNHLNIGSK